MMSIEEALAVADGCDTDDELLKSNRDALQTLAAELRGVEAKLVVAMEQAMTKLNEETERYESLGKKITKSDVAAIAAGACRFAMLIEEELGMTKDTESIRVILSRIKLKMGIHVL